MSGIPQLSTEKRATSGVYRYTSRDTIQTFKGYNHKRRIADGEFYEMNGLCGDEYPVMRTCPQRKTYSEDGEDAYIWQTEIEGLFSVGSTIAIATTNEDTTPVTADVKKGKKTVSITSAKHSYNLVIDTSLCQNSITVTGPSQYTDDIYRIPSDEKMEILYTDGAWKIESTTPPYTRTPSDYGLTITGTATAGDKIYVRDKYDGYFHPVKMGNRIWMFPSTKYIDIDTWTAGDLANTVSYATGRSIIVRPCDAEGSEITVSTTQPSNPTDGQYWLDGSTLKQYSSIYASWISVESTYVSLEATGIGTGFADGDGIKISGFETSALTFLNTDGAHVLIKKVASSNKIVLTGILGTATTETVVTNVTFERDIPKMDYVVAHENRVWGCSSNNHEIYACKLGDMTNWYVYQGIASDAYTATCIPDYNFTGAGEFGNYVAFFTENQIFRVSGTRPANFTITEITADGVKESSSYSIAAVGESLYYLGRDGIYRYSGSTPTRIVDALNRDEYNFVNGKATSTNNRYYVSVYHPGVGYELFCYDTQTGTFFKHRQSIYPLAPQGLASVGDTIHYIYQDGTAASVMLAIEGSTDFEYVYEESGMSTSDPGYFPWSAETGEIGLSLADQKYVSKITLRMEIADSATCNAYVSYDGGAYERVLSITGEGNLTSYNIPIVPQRCDHMKLKLSGIGEMHLYSISKQIEQGSEIV